MLDGMRNKKHLHSNAVPGRRPAARRGGQQRGQRALLRADARAHLGFGRIVSSEIEVPNMSVNLV
jgi:hypothetical protein